MDRRVISLSLSLSLMLLFAGCSGKKVSTSSGDAASQAGQSKSEEIKPDAIKTIPPERSFERPGGSQPSNLSLAPSTASGSNALGDVFFDYDRFQIRKDAMLVLDANAGWLRGLVFLIFQRLIKLVHNALSLQTGTVWLQFQR